VEERGHEFACEGFVSRVTVQDVLLVARAGLTLRGLRGILCMSKWSVT
jgi:hypothetical protein